MAEHAPTQFFILGGGGDLATRKLFPALFDLYHQKLLPSSFQIVGLARTQRSDVEYQNLIRESITKQQKSYDPVVVDAFCAHTRYVAGSFEEEESFVHLDKTVRAFAEAAHAEVCKIFYLAVPPTHYENIFALLHASGIAKSTSRAWTRILIEKPFGHDETSARALDTAIQGLFDEEQVYRIDHYLAKEAIQNLLSFRFANMLIRDSWNKNCIKSVHITMHEAISVSSRGAFYDKVGALRDVGQNHLLQMLALIAMEEPAVFDAAHIQQNRAAILRKLIPYTKDDVGEHVIRAQYTGYTEIPGVEENSQTETYFEFKAYIDDQNWKGVPFYVSAGKGLKNDEVTIRIECNPVPEGPFMAESNAITLTISPVQSMNITLNVKKPGYGFSLEQNTLSFAWDEEHRGIENAYEKVILDCIQGDKTLFASTDEVLASWKFISSIMDNWEHIPLQTYEEGSIGPSKSICENK